MECATLKKASLIQKCYILKTKLKVAINEVSLYFVSDKNYSSSYYPAVVYKPPSYPYGKFCEIFNDILTDRPLRGENYNFLQSFEFDKDYLHQKEFMKWSGK